MTEQVAPKNEPDKKPAALDTAGFDKLEASLNELSKAAATQSLTYLLLWLYLFFTVTAVTDYDLLIENPIKLPIFNLEIGLKKFFIAAPPLFWLVQLYMVRKLAVISEAVGEYLTAAKQQAESAGWDSYTVLERLRHRADGFVITRLLARFDDIVLSDGRRGPPSSGLAFALTVLAAGATLVVAPMLLYFGFQIRFLAHQTEWITWQHRGWVLAGLALCAAAGRTAKLSWEDSFAALSTLRRRLFRLGGARWLPDWVKIKNWPAVARPIPLSVFLSVAVFTFPGEFASDGVVIENRPLGDWLSVRIWPRTLTPTAVFDREAVAKALGDGTQTGKLDRAGPPPLDLRRRDFSERSLRGIKLIGAQLQGADLSGAQLQGADLSGAQLQGANLGRAQLQGADLTATRWWRTRTDGMQSDYAFFTPPGAEDGDSSAEPDSPEKYRPLAQQWLGGIPQTWWRTDVEQRLRRLTGVGNPEEDNRQLEDVIGELQEISKNTTPINRANYLADMACLHPDGKFIIKNIIERSSDRNDVSAAVLSDQIKDFDRCPAAKELKADYWKRLARNVEREKSVPAPR